MGERGWGRSFAVSGDSIVETVVLSGLDISLGDLMGVLGLTFGVGATFGSGFDSRGFTGISGELACFVGESGLGGSNCVSNLLLMLGTSCRN